MFTLSDIVVHSYTIYLTMKSFVELFITIMNESQTSLYKIDALTIPKKNGEENGQKILKGKNSEKRNPVLPPCLGEEK